MATTNAVHVLNDTEDRTSYLIDAHYDGDLFVAYPVHEEENSTVLIRLTGDKNEVGVPTARIVS